MSSDDNDNHDATVLPFADCEIATDIYSNLPVLPKTKRYNKSKARNKSKTQQSNGYTTEQNNYKSSYIYFENTDKENNLLTFIPYTGPSNTLHLGKRLYLPQIISTTVNDSTISLQRFVKNYDETIISLAPSLQTTFLSVYLRFGISYIIQPDISDRSMPLKNFVTLRNQGKGMKTAFYTCKGVTSPKHLLATLTKLNYRQTSSNTYSYDIQLFGAKRSQYRLLHLQYDEQLKCRSVYFREDRPTNFDFIRNKTLSLFRSIDDSYADIFDFRIQLLTGKILSKTDRDVLNTLRGLPIDQVLYIDTTTHILHVSSKLQKFVKYLKCTRSSTYENIDENLLISIGTYEEFLLNRLGQCEPLMKASNTMTIELLDLKTIPTAKKLYDIGMWFSTLCQTCVELPTTALDENSNKSCKWFSDISVFRKKSNQSIKHMNVNQLTTYKTQTSQQTYTNEDLLFVRKILQEENLRKILFDTNDEKHYDGKDIERIFESMKQRLKTNAAPSANEALRKVERAYFVLCQEFDDP